LNLFSFLLDGIFIATPEYNGFTSPLLLNAITWATRGEGDMYDGFKGKVMSVMATSPGPMGGLRTIRSLNQLLQDMGAVVIPGNNAIGNAFSVFKDGTIADERSQAKVQATCGNLVHFCRYEANREQDCAVAREIYKAHNMGEYGQVDLPPPEKKSNH
jgi:NAD(P)H-dependent FMN reductase